MIHERQFILVNKNGARWDFQQYNDYFGFNPSGLGITRGNSYIRVKDDYLLTQQIFTLKQIFLELIFLAENAYDKYREFINFIAVNEEEDFELIYIPAYNDELDRVEYFTFVQIQDIGKTEINSRNFLQVPIVFDRLSNWRLPAGEFKTITTEVGKAHPYTYPYTYRTSAAGSADLKNEGHKSTPLNFEIQGPSQNPLLELKDLDGNLLSSVQILETIVAGEKILIVSEPKEQKVVKVDFGGTETNIYEKQNFDLNTFFNLPIGDYMLFYDTAETFPGTVIITFDELFIGI